MTIQTRGALAHGADSTGLIKPEKLSIGAGFDALSFKERQFDGLMDPLVMVDHFTMTEPTFGTHPHAGMSAVSVLFEDSEGRFHNRDSLGNDFDLMPGDLYWLKAGRGAVHNEEPRMGSRTHGLQIFVNLPSRLKQTEPDSLHVKAAQMPALEGPGYRVRVVLGASHGRGAVSSPALPMTILDGKLDDATFVHEIDALHSAWLYALEGDVEIQFDHIKQRVPQGMAISIRNGYGDGRLEVHAADPAHFVLIQGTPLKECFVQQGPFVMSSVEELAQVRADYAAGRLGAI